jgi:hypothetical protein
VGCAHCGHELAPDARFCAGCGAAIAPRRLPEEPQERFRHGGTAIQEQEYEYEYVVVSTPTPQITLGALGRHLRPLRVSDAAGVGMAAAIVAGSVMAILVVAAVLTSLGVDLLSFGLDDVDQSPADWLRIGTFVVLISLGSPLTNQTELADDTSITQAGSFLLPAALLLTCTYVALRRVSTHRAREVVLPERAAVSMVAGLTAAGLVVALSLVSAGPVAGLGGAHMHARSWVGPLTAFLLVSATAMAALTPPERDNTLPRAWRVLRRAWRTSAALLAVTVVVASAVALVAGARDQAPQWGLPLVELPGSDLASFLRLPESGGLLAAVAHGATLFAAGADEDRWGLIAGNTEASAWTLMLIVLIGSVLVGVRHAFRRPPGERTWALAWTVPVAYAVMWALFAHFTQQRTWLSDEDDAFYQSGIGVVSAFLCALVWGAAATGGGWVAARWVASWFPRTAARLAGRWVHPSWAGLIERRLLMEGARVPRFISAAGRHADDSSHPPLSRGHGTVFAGLAWVLVSLALIALPTANAAECGLPLSAARQPTQPLPGLVPPSDVQRDFDEMRAEVERLDAAQARAERAAGPGVQLRDEMTAAREAAVEAMTAVTEAEDAVTNATRRVDRLADVGDWERDMLEQAQADLEEFREYDSDGFWAGLVADAEEDLLEAEAPLRRAREDLISSQARLSSARATLAAAQSAESAAESAYAPWEERLAAVASTSNAARTALVALDIAEHDWDSAAAEKRAAVARANQDARACREEARPRVIGAATSSGLAVALPLWWFGFRAPRTRRRPTAQA